MIQAGDYVHIFLPTRNYYTKIVPTMAIALEKKGDIPDFWKVAIASTGKTMLTFAYEIDGVIETKPKLRIIQGGKI